MIVLSFLKLFQDLRHYVSLKRWLFTFNLILICRYGSLIIDPFGRMLYLNLNPVVLHVFLRVVRRSAGAPAYFAVKAGAGNFNELLVMEN